MSLLLRITVKLCERSCCLQQEPTRASPILRMSPTHLPPPPAKKERALHREQCCSPAGADFSRQKHQCARDKGTAVQVIWENADELKFMPRRFQSSGSWGFGNLCFSASEFGASTPTVAWWTDHYESSKTHTPTPVAPGTLMLCIPHQAFYSEPIRGPHWCRPT